MTDRIVYACGCGAIGVIEINGSFPHYVKSRHWRESDCGTTCYRCNQPVTAINIDRLLRVEKAAARACGALLAEGTHGKPGAEAMAELLIAMHQQADQAEPGEQQGG